ncbi:hypothetical protein F444_01327 [Plasmopara halstedii]|uniref:SAP domain-containing protein n=1 Tax=Plasmopara halstedii TaxID=4781 RepID=A0A0P1AT26_PLAHL|nr:hypothetical protein F444_01327 [Plasmopara halstedii]CEG44962.1 hypothetical protein F444_01327 [Plasmopara halstedii]|eukprot:XP_024581331.1 hypothetical protein F444_01327 [Plasmopara halstedii]
MLAFRGHKKQKVPEPTGKDAVNFRKLLFLPINETENLLSHDAWERLDLRWLELMKRKMLQASCVARGLPSNGNKSTLIQRLAASLSEQREAENRQQQEEEEDYERQLDMLGGVWSFGSGFAGQLGHGNLESSTHPKLVKDLRGCRIAHVYAGFDSDVAFALSRTGDIYVWGKRSGPTGLPSVVFCSEHADNTHKSESDIDLSENEQNDEEDSKKLTDTIIQPDQALFERCEDERNESIKLENCTKDRVEDIVLPVKLSTLCGEGVKHIAVGRVHCCAVTKDGDVYTWGQNDHCQLGAEPIHNVSEVLLRKARHGNDCVEPQLWESTVLETCVISIVAVGTNHTFAVTDKGEMMAFGATYNTREHCTFARNIAKLRVSQITCGALHAGLVTDEGQAYTWGSGDGGRLGHGDNMSFVHPKLVDALKTDIIVELACACWHTVAIVLIPPLLKGGMVYTWGSGRLGQLAQGGKQMSALPGLVTDLLTTHALIRKVCAGMYHNVALSVDDEVFTWGSNLNGCLGRPNELKDLEETFCAVPGRVEGMDNFIGRPCSIAAGREFTLIATKPYIGPSQEEIQRQKEEEQQHIQSIKRQMKVVDDEKRDQLQRIQQCKHEVILANLNANYPRCTICTTSLICPGFQPNPDNPTLCKHCIHDQHKHHGQLQASDSHVTLPFLTQSVEKLGIQIDFSHIADIGLEDELEALLDEKD